jgi:hypothetical protein
MKTIKSRKITMMIFAVLVLLVSAPSVLAYPPDNAAILYYKAFMLYQADDEMNDMLLRFAKGRIELNEKIKEFVNNNRQIVNTVLDASEIKHCDWGLDYSQGTEVLLPPLHKLRQLLGLVLADARIPAQRGDYKTALSRCISVYKMAQHLNERPVILYIVGIAFNAVTNDCIIQILSDMPPDVEMLTWLKCQLAHINKQSFSIKPTLSWKRQAGIISMSPERISDAVHSGIDDGPFKEKVLKRILAADEQFFDRNREYWNRYMDNVEAAFDLPSPQGYAKLKKLDEELTEEFSKNPDSTLTASLFTTWQRIYNLSTRWNTHSNALKSAIEIYMMKAKTGKLPDALPAGLPGDLFSGKPFQYTQTADGFILRCRGKDLEKDEIYEYEFKVKK